MVQIISVYYLSLALFMVRGVDKMRLEIFCIVKPVSVFHSNFFCASILLFSSLYFGPGSGVLHSQNLKGLPLILGPDMVDAVSESLKCNE